MKFFVLFSWTTEITLGIYRFTNIKTSVGFTATEKGVYLALVSCHEGGCSITNSGGLVLNTLISESATVAKSYELDSGDQLSLYASGSGAGYATVCNAVFKIYWLNKH